MASDRSSLISARALWRVAVSVCYGRAPGRVTGTVRNETNAVVPNAMVSIHVRPSAAPFQPFDATTNTAANGTFSFEGVPAGLYEICAQAPVADYIPSCIWPVAPTRVTVNPGQTVTAPMVLRQGHRLKVRLNDPNGAIAARGPVRPLTDILIGVSGSVLGMLTMNPGATDPKFREYSLLVPFDTNLELSIRSAVYRMADSKSVAIDAQKGHRQTVRVSKSAPGGPIEFSIGGVHSNAPAPVR